MAIPLAIGFVILRSLHRLTESRFPTIPVRMMTDVVRAGMPSNSAETSTPMAVVTDLGSRLTALAVSSRNAHASSRMLPTLVTTPAPIPVRIARTFFLSLSHCSYRGTARLTVAGNSRYVSTEVLP